MGQRWTLRNGGYIVAAPPISKRTKPVMLAVLRAMRAEGHNITTEEVMGKSRVQHVAFARQLNCFILWAHYGFGSSEIGRSMGLHHSTVIYSCSSAVRCIEWHGWAGRAYVKAAEELGLQLLDYVHPQLTDRAKTTREELERLALTRARGADVTDAMEDEDDEDQYVKPMNWTKEEMDELALLDAYPGGPPESVITDRSNAKKRYTNRTGKARH